MKQAAQLSTLLCFISQVLNHTVNNFLQATECLFYSKVYLKLSRNTVQDLYYKP